MYLRDDGCDVDKCRHKSQVTIFRCGILIIESKICIK